MAEQERARALVARLGDAVRELEAADLSCPDGVDRFLWSADLLDEMARTVESVARIADRHAPGDTTAIPSRAATLSQAITAQRNELLRSGRGTRPVTNGTPEDRVPGAGRADRRRAGGVVAPAQWLMEREWASRAQPHE